MASRTAMAGDPEVGVALAALKQSIADRFDALPKRLQQAARYLVDHPNTAGVETIRTLASAAGVQPSVLVRLAQSLGFEGFSEMQAVFKDALIEQTQSYGERMRARQRVERSPLPASASDALRSLCRGSIGALQVLHDAHDAGALDAAVVLLARCPAIHVIGLRRSWPIANYLVYLLLRSRRIARQLGGIGGMLEDELQTVGADDVLVAISFHPFHEQVIAAAEQAQARGIKVIAITDTRLSRLARCADRVLEVRDAEIGGFRSVAASMMLCQALAVSVAAASGAGGPGQRRPRR